MGNFVERITLENSMDRRLAESGYLKEPTRTKEWVRGMTPNHVP